MKSDTLATTIPFLSFNSFLQPEHIVDSAWLQHAPFVFWLVEQMDFDKFVELGTHNGYSYFAVCQAVKKLSAGASCYAIDTWEGDEHAGFYDESVFYSVNDANQQYASFSTLIVSSFDDAATYFADRSIGFLHIDGRHFYEDVKHDYMTWLPKLTDDAIVLFHDTNVRERGFGVWRLFDELRAENLSFEFMHGHGLGIIALGRVPESLAQLMNADQATTIAIREIYSRLGANIKRMHEAQKTAADSKVLLAGLQSRAAVLSKRAELQVQDLIHALTKSESGRKVAVPKELVKGRFARKPNGDRVAKDFEMLVKSSLFDPDWYVAEYPDVLEKEEATLHFLKYGGKYALRAGPYFDTKKYLEVNTSFNPLNENPLVHFLRSPAKEETALALARHLLGTTDAVEPRLSSPSAAAGPSYSSANNWQIDLPDLFEVRSFEPVKRVAVVIHIYYEDVCDELLDLCINISEPYDVFISLTEGHTSHLQAKIKNRFPAAFVLIFPNRGRDILPFFALARTGVFANYDVLLKLHSKRSPHREDGDEWRKRLTLGILGAPAEIIAAFRADPNLGIVVADGEIVRGEDAWLGNLAHTDRLLPSMGFSPHTAVETAFASGSIFWIRPFLLRDLCGLPISLEMFEPEPIKTDGALAHSIERLFSISCRAAGMRIDEASTVISQRDRRDLASPDRSLTPRIVAFYLPQFHPIPENDAWWGKGFTEWTNVANARPLFPKHRQPRLPGELGYTDLRVAETRKAQADLARSYGVSAFCYYYYWFGDGRRVLERPLDEVMESGKPDFPFMICWANEPWTRNWDGVEKDVLIPQDYPQGWVDAFARSIAPVLKDERYVRLGGCSGPPILLIYRIMSVPYPADALQQLRHALRRLGVGPVHIAAGWFALGSDPVPPADPSDLGLDSYFEFPPHNIQTVKAEIGTAPPAFAERLFQYGATVDAALAQPTQHLPRSLRHRGVMMGWDNTARRGTAGHAFHGATPGHFRRWLQGVVRQQRSQKLPEERLIFVNAWNEWAEGSCLEPDRDFGRGWLEAVRSVVLSPTSEAG